jgi:3-oxoacyl-[acyl-carrier-protein] synthase III
MPRPILRSVITGTGSYIPAVIKKNCEFSVNEFYTDNHIRIGRPAIEIAEKFKQITGIEERRYAPDEANASDMASCAARSAITDSGIDPETIDQIILAHNFGDVSAQTIQTDNVPSLASRVKHDLGIRNPECIAYDILFGCPGWLQGLIQADIFIRAGEAKKCLVIGTETLSRVIDPYDRDSMIFSDGAGACVLQSSDSPDREEGLLGASVLSHCVEEISYIHFEKSYNPTIQSDTRYIKMKGRKVYEYALRYVPDAMKHCLEKSGVEIGALKKIFIHQANEKMDEAIIRAFYNLYGVPVVPEQIMPMSIHWLGNSSVATIPTLFDLVRKGHFPEHSLRSGDIVMFASVGAGMNINAVCYRY